MPLTEGHRIHESCELLPDNSSEPREKDYWQSYNDYSTSKRGYLVAGIRGRVTSTSEVLYHNNFESSDGLRLYRDTGPCLTASRGKRQKNAPLAFFRQPNPILSRAQVYPPIHVWRDGHLKGRDHGFDTA